MGIHRKPTIVHELSGAFKKNPQRGKNRLNEPVPRAGIGPAPSHLDDAEQLAWDEIVNILPGGVAYDSDRLALEMTAVLLVRFRRDKSDIPAALFGRLESMLGRFGLTPADRSKILVPDKAAKNPFGQL
jgi:hypothetical protein